MKNTMKKLLCMALAIMLLVSAVPVFAAAANVPVPYTITIDGNPVTSGTHQANDTDSLLTMLDVIYPGYTAYQVAIEVNGAEVSGAAAVPTAGTVLFKLTTPPAPQVEVTITLSGVGSRVFNVEKGSKLTLNEALLTSHGLSLSYNHSIAQWNDLYNPTNPIANGTTVTVNDNNTFTCTQRSNDVSNGNNNNNNNNNNNQAANKNVTLNIVNVSGGSVVWTKTDSLSGDSTTVKSLLYYWYGGRSNSWQNSYDCTKAWSKAQQKDVGYEGTIAAGDTVTVVLSPKTNNGGTVTPPSGTTSGNLNLVITANGAVIKQEIIQNFGQDTVYNIIRNKLNDANWTNKYGFNEVVINGVTYYRTDLVVKGGDTVNISLSRKYSKDNSNKVYLHVYLNGDASTIAMTKDITGTYLMDDWKTDTNEILNYLKNNYYSAKDATNAITIDGLYVSTDANGTFPTKYYADNKVASKDRINDLLEDGFVHISVMLKNAKAKSSATADTSNPKTGDTIFVPVMVMGLTGSVLAAAYIFGKKRIAR